MAALPPKQMVESIHTLAQQFNTLYWATAGGELSPEDFSANLFSLKGFRKEIVTSVENLPMADQRSFQTLIARTEYQLDQLEGRVHQVAGDIFGQSIPELQFCESPALPITLSFLSHPHVGIEVFPQATERMEQLRVGDAKQQVKMLEHTIYRHQAYSDLKPDAQEALHEGIQALSTLVAEETACKNAISPASYANFHYMQSQIRSRSFFALQQIFALFTEEVRGEIVNELENLRLVPLFEPILPLAIMAPTKEGVDALLKADNFPLAIVAALKNADQRIRDGSLLATCSQLLKRMGQSEVQELDAEHYSKLLVVMLGQMKNPDLLFSIIMRIRQTPELTQKIFPDLLNVIRNLPHDFHGKSDILTTFFRVFPALCIQEQGTILAILDEIPYMQMAMSLYVFLQYIHPDRDFDCILSLIDKTQTLADVNYKEFVVNLCSSKHFGIALHTILHMQSPPYALMAAKEVLKHCNGDKEMIFQLIQENVAEPEMQRKLIELFNLI